MKKLIMKKLMMILMVMVLIVSTSQVLVTAYNNDYADPNYEIKFFLSPQAVLNSDHKLKSSVRNAFDMPSSVTKMRVQFLDNEDLELDEEGWCTRIRKKENQNAFELTYKKRYPIVNGNIEAALALAAQDGFDADENDYEAQVDWGYSKQTLSFSNQKEFTDNSYSGMSLPNLNDSIDVAVDKAPGKFENWFNNHWGTDILEESKLYGSVNAKRSIGEFSNKETYIEIWEILNVAGTGYEYVVEISLKENDYEDAVTLRTDLQEFLEDEGWLIEGDVLKTQMILSRYS